jgi:hypothetical protein
MLPLVFAFALEQRASRCERAPLAASRAVVEDAFDVAVGNDHHAPNCKNRARGTPTKSGLI